MPIQRDLNHEILEGKDLFPFLAGAWNLLSAEDAKLLGAALGAWRETSHDELIRLFHYDLTQSLEDIPEMLRRRWMPVLLDGAPGTSGTASGKMDPSIRELLWLTDETVLAEQRYWRARDYDHDASGNVRWLSAPPNLAETVRIVEPSESFTLGHPGKFSDIGISGGQPVSLQSKLFLRSPSGITAEIFPTKNVAALRGEPLAGTWTVFTPDGLLTGTEGYWLSFFTAKILWAEYAYLDDRRLFHAFGSLIRFKRPSSEVYKRQIQALFYAYFHSPTMFSLHQGVNAILNLPYNTLSGTVTSVRSAPFPAMRVIDGEMELHVEENGVSGPVMQSGSLWIGYPSPFDVMEFLLADGGESSGGAGMFMEYWDGEKMEPLRGFTDFTAGLSSSGAIRFPRPGNWKPGRQGDAGSGLFFVRLAMEEPFSIPPSLFSLKLFDDELPMFPMASEVAFHTGEKVLVPSVLGLHPSVVVGATLPRFSPLSTAIVIEDRISNPAYLDDPVYSTAFFRHFDTTGSHAINDIRTLLKANLFVVRVDGAASQVISGSGFSITDIFQFVSAVKPRHTTFVIRHGDTLLGIDLSVSASLDVSEKIGTPYDYGHRLRTDAAFEAEQDTDYAGYEADPASFPAFHIDTDRVELYDGVETQVDAQISDEGLPEELLQKEPQATLDVSSVLPPFERDGTVQYLGFLSGGILEDTYLSGSENLSPAMARNLSREAPEGNFPYPPLQVGAGDNENAIWRGALKFLLTSIPAGSEIVSAALRLKISSAMANAGGTLLNVHRLLENLTAQATWNGIADDFASTESAFLSLPASPAEDDMILSSNLSATVQAWLDGTLPNFGMLVKSAFEPTEKAYLLAAISAVAVGGNEQGFSGEAATAEDALLAKDDPDTEYGETLDPLATGTGATSSSVFRSAMLFTLPAIPEGATIQSARLRLTVFSAGAQASGRVLDIYRAAMEWDEATATWNILADDYEPALMGSVTVSSLPVQGNVLLSGEIKNLVADWLVSPASNFGIILRDRVEPSDSAEPFLRVLAHEITAGGPLENQVTIPASQDIRLNKQQPSTNQGTSDLGTGAFDASGNYDLNAIYRSALKFAVHFDLPEGAVVSQAILKLTAKSGSLPNAAGRIIHIHKATVDVNEVTANWNNTANAYNSAVSGQMQLANPLNTSTHAVTSSDLSAIVQSWLDTPSGNLGIILKDSLEPSSAPAEVEQPLFVTQDPAMFRDATIAQLTPNANFGSAIDLKVKKSSSSSLRFLIRIDDSVFDQLLALGANEFLEATLTLKPVSFPVGSVLDFEKYRIPSSWAEGSVTWNDAVTNGNFFAAAYHLTQDNRLDTTQPNPVLNLDLRSVFYEWRNSAESNFGIGIKNTSFYWQDNDVVTFASREHADSASRPKLTVRYTTWGGTENFETAALFANKESGASGPVLEVSYVTQGAPEAGPLSDQTALVLSDGAPHLEAWGLGTPLYIGHTEPFDEMAITLATASEGVSAFDAAYWDGAAWQPLTVADGTNNLTTDGSITFGIPTDWAAGGSGALMNGRYFIRLTPGSAPSVSPAIKTVSLLASSTPLDSIVDSDTENESNVEFYSKELAVDESLPEAAPRLLIDWTTGAPDTAGSLENQTPLIIEEDAPHMETWVDGTPLYVGHVEIFDEIAITLNRGAGAVTDLDAHYWDGSSWQPLSVADGTSALTQDGSITFAAPTDWETGGDLPLLDGKHFVRITPADTPSVTPLIATLTVLSDGTELPSTIIQIPGPVDSEAAISATGDAEIRSKNPADNYGDVTSFRVGRLNPNNLYRALLKFSLGSIPPGAEILGAELKIRSNSKASDANGVLLNLHRINASWTENGVTWTDADAQGFYQASPAITHNLGSSLGDHNISGAGLLALVEAWHSGTPNYGLLLKTNENANNAYWQFLSREVSDINQEPRLTVQYRTAAEPQIQTLTVFSEASLLVDWQKVIPGTSAPLQNLTALVLAADEPHADGWGLGLPVYVGHRDPFDEIVIALDTPAEGVTSMEAHYWNGSSWQSLSVADGTDALSQDGSITFTPPGNWTKGGSDVLFEGRYFIRLSPSSNPDIAPVFKIVSVKMNGSPLLSTISVGTVKRMGHYIHRVLHDDPPLEGWEDGPAFREANGLIVEGAPHDAAHAVAVLRDDPEKAKRFVLGDDAINPGDKVVIARLK